MSPGGKSNAFRGIVAFDLDGTLLRGPTVSELIADGLGRLEQMRKLENFKDEAELITVREEIARWYAEKSVSTLLSYLKGARWAPGAHEAIARLQERGIHVVILSITWQDAVEWFASKLNVSDVLGTQHLPSGEIVHVFGRDKARYLREFTATARIARNRVAAVGDSLGDVEMLLEADLRFFVGKEAPALEGVIHLPDVDLNVVADAILHAWAV